MTLAVSIPCLRLSLSAIASLALCQNLVGYEGRSSADHERVAGASIEGKQVVGDTEEGLCSRTVAGCPIRMVEDDVTAGHRIGSQIYPETAAPTMFLKSVVVGVVVVTAQEVRRRRDLATAERSRTDRVIVEPNCDLPCA